MNASEFKRVLTAFADTAADVDMTKGRLARLIRFGGIAAPLSIENSLLMSWPEGRRFAL